MNDVLAGIRVLDFGRYIAGPYCAALLADLGADVIRAERRGGGEDRWVAPVGQDGVGAMFLVMNRNKRAMTLDPRRRRAGRPSGSWSPPPTSSSPTYPPRGCGGSPSTSTACVA
jgi:crotonobetainyl-CoA:carnitine CoA-transferase CaiB-like acyl-CoA transferase